MVWGRLIKFHFFVGHFTFFLDDPFLFYLYLFFFFFEHFEREGCWKVNVCCFGFFFFLFFFLIGDCKTSR